MRESLLPAGKIVNTHGIKGEVRIYPLCDSAEFLLDFDRFYIDGAPMHVISSRTHKNMLLAKFENINNIATAEPLIGKQIFIDRADAELSEGQYFIEDLKGMRVLDIDSGFFYGTLQNIIQTGANDVFEVKGEKTYLIPKIDSVVLKIDTEKNEIYIRPMEGLMDL